MQDDTRQVVSQRIQAPERVIEGMGYPGQGVPVHYMEFKKSPLEKITVHWTNMRIRENIRPVIPVNELIPKGRKIDDERQQGKRGGKMVFSVLSYFHGKAVRIFISSRIDTAPSLGAIDESIQTWILFFKIYITLATERNRLLNIQIIDRGIKNL